MRTQTLKPCRVGSVGSVLLLARKVVSSPLGRVIPKTIIKMVQIASLHRHACVRVGVWQCSPTVLKRPGSVWNCLWGYELKRSPGIIRKSRVSYPGPGFLSSATWPSLPKKHNNGLNQTKPNFKRFSKAVHTRPCWAVLRWDYTTRTPDVSRTPLSLSPGSPCNLQSYEKIMTNILFPEKLRYFYWNNNKLCLKIFWSLLNKIKV